MNQQISSKTLLVSRQRETVRVALAVDGRIDQLAIEHQHRGSLVGNIYLGTVVRVLPSMQAAFVEIGQVRTAFLHIDDIPDGKLFYHTRQATMPKQNHAIEYCVRTGDQILVQIIKDAFGDKGARLSCKIALSSRHLVYLPNERGEIGISNKLKSSERTQLKHKLTQLICQEKLQGGLIVRTAAASADERILQAEIGYLAQLWQSLLNQIKQTQPKQQSALIYQEPSLPFRWARDLAGDELERIWIDDAALYQQFCQFAQTTMPALMDKMAHYTDAVPLFERYGVEQAIQTALSRRVPLKSGGYLIIDLTEAMTVIDVNTGSFVGKHTPEALIVQTNIEAAAAIARQLRLRNIAGIIIIDFIDMNKPSNRQAVLNNLKQHLADDPVKTNIVQISELGLVEMTRERKHESLRQALCQPCPVCEGSGQIKRVETVCDEILRELLKTARASYASANLTVLAHPETVAYLLKTNLLADFECVANKKIAIQAMDLYLPTQFAIIAS